MDINYAVYLSQQLVNYSGVTSITAAAANKLGEVAIKNNLVDVSPSVGSGLEITEFVAIGGFIVMILSNIWNVYVTRKRDKREDERAKREHELYMRSKEETLDNG